MSSSSGIDKEQLRMVDRQARVLGLEALIRLQKANVLIIGLNGVGVEIAKNVILIGVKSVTIHDNANASWFDLSSQFYLSEASIGKNRAEACIDKLKELNPYVTVNAHSGDLSLDFLKNFTVVVSCDASIASLIDLNEQCRQVGAKFIAVESRGLSGAMFCDFGLQFEIFDEDGEPLVSNIVIDVSNEKEAFIAVHDEKRTHGLYDGDLVVFDHVKGMEELNKLEPVSIKVTGKHTFTIPVDTSKFGKYQGGGYVRSVKKVKHMDFATLKESISNPKIVETDFSKFTRSAELHAIYQALNEFITTLKALPRSYNEEDAQKMIQLVAKFNKDVPEDVTRKFSYTCKGNLNPLAAFLGGIAAQEVQKACTGKFHPLTQWLYFDAFECLPEVLPSEQDTAPVNSRYDGQVAIFGSKFQETLLNSRIFLVGSGALGCEYLKNFAMMGLGCSPRGRVIVTDMDNIEISNLNRQFLFRKKHVGAMKSTVAVQAAKEMNAALNCSALNDKVAPQTENIFDDEFWDNIDCVTNALDNIQARLYVDSRCVFYRKPLLEAGTLGTKANVQVVVPDLTESYGSTPDPPEQEIPICTLKNFPNAIEHTIQWARDSFEGFFKQQPEDVNRFLTANTREDYFKELDSQGNAASKKSTLEAIYENLVSSRASTFEDCVVWARLKFEELFNHTIQQLLYLFPLDAKTSSGSPFWFGPKKPPTPLEFSTLDQVHMGFIEAAAVLRAQIYNISVPEKYDLVGHLNHIQVPKFTPRANVKIAANEEEAKEQAAAEEGLNADDEEAIAQVQEKLPNCKEKTLLQLNPIHFEKDDDTNHHVDFVTCASNLRARNYGIKEADKHETKGIAGKIIPAMVTTTAAITGLASLEMYKVFMGKTKIEDYKNAFMNVALPFVAFGEPNKAAYKDVCGMKISFWDKLKVSFGKDITVQELIDYFNKTYKVVTQMISYNNALLYGISDHRLPMTVSAAAADASKTAFAPRQKYLVLAMTFEDEQGNDVDLPPVLYQFRGF